MKKILVLILCLIGQSVWTQITLTENNKSNNKKIVVEKQEAINFKKELLTSEKAKIFIGEKGFFAPKETFFEPFYIDEYKVIKGDNKSSLIPSKTIKYKLNKDEFTELISNKKFEIIDIISAKKLGENILLFNEKYKNKGFIKKKSLLSSSQIREIKDLGRETYYENNFYFKIKLIESGFIIYVHPNSCNQFLILDKYFNHLEKLIGEKLIVLSDSEDYNANKVIKLNSNEKILIEKKSIFNVKKITYYNFNEIYPYSNYQLAFVLDNIELGEIIYPINTKSNNPFSKIPISTASYTDFKKYKEYKKIRQIDSVKNKIKADSLVLFKKETEKKELKNKEENIKKYGAKFGKLINENKVDIGMSKEMVIKSIGSLFKETQIIDESGTFTIWEHPLFDFQIHFKNNKVIRIIKK